MSRDHLVRFNRAYERDPSLREEMDRLRGDERAWRRHASKRGFELTSDEVRGLLSGYQELSDDDLDEVAGGWDDPQGGTGGSSPPPQDPPLGGGG